MLDFELHSRLRLAVVTDGGVDYPSDMARASGQR